MPLPPDGSSLCLLCGLGCEGVLHTYAVTTPVDRRRLRALGLSVEPFGNHRLPPALPARSRPPPRANLMTTPEAQAAHAARQQAVDWLDHYLQRHFRKQSEHLIRLEHGYNCSKVLLCALCQI